MLHGKLRMAVCEKVEWEDEFKGQAGRSKKTSMFRLYFKSTLSYSYSKRLYMIRLPKGVLAPVHYYKITG